MDDYRAPRWLVGGNAQTIWPALFGRRPDGAPPCWRRERWDTPDGDFVDADWQEDDAVRPDAPLLVLFHGLEGSSSSHYARAFAGWARRHGWRFVVPHFRGCSGEMNRAPRAYHSGDFEEIGWMLAQARRRPAGRVVAVGVSLGGNALLRWAETHPGEPLTHATLNAAGLHALATALDVAALIALAAELGLERDLKKRPNGFWTHTAVIDAYAELCRTRGITLSSTALIAMGGVGCTLFGRARQLFGTFAAFQVAVMARYPDIKPPDRPTAQDGRRLDSWQEVVAYNAMRVAFPDAVIDTHVLLAGTRRSCDFVLNGSCYVEVLRLGKTEMATPRNADARKYAAQWSAKMALYQALGVTPVMIEPDDIHRPERLAARMAEIAAQLALPMHPLPAASGEVVRAKGHWNFGTLCAAVAEVANAVGRWPTHAELTTAGYGHATNLLRKPGMAARVASEIGRALLHQKGVWSEETIVAGFAAWAVEHGRYPTGDDLVADGLHLLHGARRRLFAGRPEELRARVEQRCGKALPRRRGQK